MLTITDGRRVVDVGATIAPTEFGWSGTCVPREDLVAAYFLGEGYPGLSPLYDYRSLGQVGTLQNVGDAAIGTAKMTGGGGKYLRMPYTAPECAGPLGMSGWVVAEFTEQNSQPFGNYNSSQAPSLTLARVSTAYRLGMWQNGTDYFCDIPLDGYAGAGKQETFVWSLAHIFTGDVITGTLMELFRFKPGGTIQSATPVTSPILISALGSNPLRFGQGQNAPHNVSSVVYSGGIYSAPKDATKAQAVYDPLKVFHGGRAGGVAI